MSKEPVSFANQRVYTLKDAPYLSVLASYTEGLRNDFLNAHPDYHDKNKLIEGLELSRPPTDGAAEKASYVVSAPEAWNSSWVKYQTAQDAQEYFNDNNLEKYPTAKRLVKDFLGKDCGIALYSVIEPFSFIGRHTDPENRENKFVRVHIPLVLTKGDVFIEIDGEEAHYSSIFAFNNQYVHSAHNYTNERRLVFLLDVRREILRLPPADPYIIDLENNAEPFKRNGVIWNPKAEVERLKSLQKQLNPA